eukprot:UN24342
MPVEHYQTEKKMGEVFPSLYPLSCYNRHFHCPRFRYHNFLHFRYEIRLY